jgi:hypothetical protein
LLVRSAGHHCFAFQAGDRPRIGIDAVMLGGPATHQLTKLVVDLRRSLGELGHQLIGDADHVGVAIDHRAPSDTEAGGHLGAQGGVVDPADAALLVLEEPGIQRQPRARRVLDLGPDHRVGVQLRIGGAARVLAEQRRN